MGPTANGSAAVDGRSSIIKGSSSSSSSSSSSIIKGSSGNSGGGIIVDTASVSSAANAAPSARESVLRGLVKALMPWEHSRRPQRAALLVLGNILGNAPPETRGGGVGHLGGAQLSEYSKCAAELRRAVTAQSFEGGGGWGEAGGGEGGGEGGLSECDRYER